MAIDDIKKAILDEAQKIADEHREEGRKKAKEIEKAWEQKINARKQEVTASAGRKIEQRIQQAKFQIQTESQSKILEKKREIIDQAYSSALKKLSTLSDAQYLKLMEKLIKELPESGGQLFSVESKKNLLKKALENSGKKHQLAKEIIDGEGGFIFRTDKLEINQSFKIIIKNLEETSLLAVTNKIFGEEK